MNITEERQDLIREAIFQACADENVKPMLFTMNEEGEQLFIDFSDDVSNELASTICTYIEQRVPEAFISIVKDSDKHFEYIRITFYE